MKNNDWWKNSTVYQVYPRSFCDSNGDGIGDIKGIIKKLDYLSFLGIDVIWLSPIYESPQVDNGYDISDYKKIYPAFGTMEDFEQLIKEAHKRSLKILMDLVVNHTSDKHPWFLDSKKNKQSLYRDFYIWRKPKSEGIPPNNWGSFFGGSAWTYEETTKEYYLHLFAKEQPDLNWENPKLRQKIYDIMRFWLDKGIAGFRMDVINLISKDQNFPDGKLVGDNFYTDGSPYYCNGPRIHEFLKEMHANVMTKYNVFSVGEMPGVSPNDAKIYTDFNQKELSMVFTFEHMGLDAKLDKWDLKPLSLVELKKNFEKWQKTLHKVGWNSLYWNNHDQPRIVSRFGDDKKYRVKSAKMLGACLHMMQGTPFIYQGEEIGMTNNNFTQIFQLRDVETINMITEKKSLGWSSEKIWKAICAKGRDNARTPMQWDKSLHSGFTTGTPWLDVNKRYKEINVKEALANKDSIFYFYKKLIRLRKDLKIITEGDFNLLLPDDNNLFVYVRSYNAEKLLVICNFSDKTITISDTEVKKMIISGEIILSNYFLDKNQYEILPYAVNVHYINECKL